MELETKNNKIIARINHEVYEFEIDELMKYILIVNDKSRKGKIFKIVAKYIFENDLKVSGKIQIKEKF